MTVINTAPGLAREELVERLLAHFERGDDALPQPLEADVLAAPSGGGRGLAVLVRHGARWGLPGPFPLNPACPLKGDLSRAGGGKAF